MVLSPVWKTFRISTSFSIPPPYLSISCSFWQNHLVSIESGSFDGLVHIHSFPLSFFYSTPWNKLSDHNPIWCVLWSSFNHSPCVSFSFFIPLFESQQMDTRTSPINESKTPLTEWDKEGDLSVLKKATESGNVMGCYDTGFVMIQGIGCEEDLKGGLELIAKRGVKHEESGDTSWKSSGSATDVVEPQTMRSRGLSSLSECSFWMMFCVSSFHVWWF